jgi:hypothetical protein
MVGYRGVSFRLVFDTPTLPEITGGYEIQLHHAMGHDPYSGKRSGVGQSNAGSMIFWIAAVSPATNTILRIGSVPKCESMNSSVNELSRRHAKLLNKHGVRGLPDVPGCGPDEDSQR